MRSKYRILLIESDDYSSDVLQRFIETYFFDFEVVPVKPAASVDLLHHNCYDIIICDADLQLEERIDFVRKVCRKANTYLIVITGHTDITPETFSRDLNKHIHHILYKPLDLEVLGRVLRGVVRRVEAGKKKEAKEPD